MNEKDTRKRREWVKNAAIVFLAVMLALTFFSNTIMNYSLPEVATQYVQRGSITAKVRGTGNVVATDPYNVEIKESRVISSVAVKQGDVVEKDQVLYYLEDAESEELKKAEAELEDLKLSYMKGLFGSNVSPEIISKVASGNVDGFSALKAKVTDMQARLDEAQERVKACQENLDKLSLQSTISTNDSSASIISDKLESDLATADMEQIKTAFETRKTSRLAELENEIQEKSNQIKDLEDLIANAQDLSGEQPAASPSAGASEVFNERKSTVIEKIKALRGGSYSSSETFPSGDDPMGTEADVQKWYNGVKWEEMTSDAQLALQADYGEYRTALDLLKEAARILNQYGGSSTDQLSRLESLKSQLASLQSKRAEVEAINVTGEDNYKDALNRLNQATRNITELTSAGEQASAAYKNQIANAEAALKTAQSLYDLLKEEQTLMNADINAELDLSKSSRDIIAKQEEIEKLKEKSIGAEIKAPVAGTVTTLTYKAGETTKPEEPAAVIQVEGKGYTLSISVTNDQAKKVQVGDEAEVQNAWYYDDVHLILASIKPDPDAPGQKQLLNFDVTGTSIQDGQALNISVGQRSSEYELVVPNSAVREDNNGKFILTVESKSSPLGNRYIATRVDVEVLASDDNNTAISAPLYGYEYVITTSTKPVEAGKQVRLNE